MKKLFLVMLCLAMVCSLFACNSSNADTLPTMLSQNEYVLYQNIFYNDMAEDYLGKRATKLGTLTRVYDAFNNRTRYYVWGYMDATKCCDWQWEFVPADPDSLPANGSLVKLTGTLTRDEAALDQIWLIDTTVELETAFTPEACDVDMTTMGATLERVQLLNMQYKPEAFAGQSLRIYGRVLSPTTIQHPYYDNAWTQDFESAEAVPAIGTMVILTGIWQGSAVQANRVEATADY